MLAAFEEGLEKFIFAARWLLAPVYVGLIGALAVIGVKFFQELWHLFETIIVGGYHTEANDIVLGTLGLLDMALLGNLVLIIIFAGYENFVSKIGAAEESEDRPHWMGHVDFSGLKIKLIGSMVAISVIHLLQDFVAAGSSAAVDSHGDPIPMDYEAVMWRIILHITFVISGVMFAWMDMLSDRRKVLLDVHNADMEDRGAKH